MVIMKERQRWQPEEDALLRAYVKQYGPKEWHLISQRMNRPLDRDPKSCLERWKNYLKPGIKRGSLTPEEQNLVICLQAKYGNKWKKTAAEVPGRTAKRLGKWWEVFKEKQLKNELKNQNQLQYRANSSTSDQGKYDHILETFAEKYVHVQSSQQKSNDFLGGGGGGGGLNNNTTSGVAIPEPVLSLGPVSWISNVTTSSSLTTTSCSSTPSSSVSLTLSPSDTGHVFDPIQQMGLLILELEEGKENWVRHRKEATWRLTRLEQQLESEKSRRRREKMEEMEEEIKRLREEEAAYLSRMEGEYREQLNTLQRDAEAKEAKLMEAWNNSQARLGRLLQRFG